MTRADRRMRVTVLMGGTSSERAISLSTGTMIRNALDPMKYEVSVIDTRDLVQLAAPETTALAASFSERDEIATGERNNDLVPSDRKARKHDGEETGGACVEQRSARFDRTEDISDRPDIVFIALHGKGGEDGSVQGMLEMLGLPYTGSGVLASALAMDKAMTKRLLKPEGIAVIEEVQVRRGQSLEHLAAQIDDAVGGLPVFVKPNAEGSTVGCTLVETTDALRPAVEEALRFDPIVLVERYVRGIEITVSVLGNAGGDLEPLPTVEIVPRAAFYDYESKYSDGGSEHVIPARLPVAVQYAAQEIAMRCHNLLGCRGMSRTDMIVSEGKLYVLEINTIPGMTPTSLLPQAAAKAGIDFPTLLDRVIGYAVEER